MTDHHDHSHAHGGPGVSRRDLLKAGAAGSVLALMPTGALAQALGPGAEFGTSRASRLGRRTRLAHADLHNHSQFSDGTGNPALAHDSMRSAGLDVAALTDHTVAARSFAPLDPCRLFPPPGAGEEDPCRSLVGSSETAWEDARRFADGADDPGEFTALRGFEWSSPYLGHVNVWFTEDWTDPLSTAGLTAAGLAGVGITEPVLRQLLAPLPEGEEILALILASEPAGMARFYDWLATSPNAVLGGGADGIAGFNHPNREPAVFDAFAFDPRVRERMVSMEIMNRHDDFVFMGYEDGQPSPLTSCLDAGWRVGLLGVTDEHGTDWGYPDGKGRAGLYVDELSRAGVRRALAGRNFFATNVRGLRLDATAQNTPMGQTVCSRAPVLTFRVDIDRGPEFAGMPLEIQVLTSGEEVPSVVHVESVTMPSPDERRPIRFRAAVDRAATSWVVLRIADPSLPNTSPGPAGHPCNNLALAYTSPFFLQGGRPPRSRGPRRPAAVAQPSAGEALRLLTHGH